MKIAQQPTAVDPHLEPHLEPNLEPNLAHDASGLSSAQRHLIVGFIKQRGGSWSIGELAGALDASAFSATWTDDDEAFARALDAIAHLERTR